MTLADTEHAGRVTEPEPGFYTVIINDRVYRCAPNRLPDGTTEIIVNGEHIPVSVVDPKRRAVGSNGAASGSGKAVLTAPMPGKVVKLLVAVGDEVVSEQGLMVVEAMKMQNEVQSPRAGKVQEIRVVAGQTVNAGETLIVVE